MSALYETAANLSALPSIHHGFFGRLCNDDAEFNMSEKFGPAEKVAANYTQALSTIGVPGAKLARLIQTHSNRVVTVTADTDFSNRPDADGIVTKQTGIALSILTADCAPLLFADAQAGVIGACHAGWKGAVSGVIANTIAAMIALGATKTNIFATIGPTISGPNYEVGPEFAANLLAVDPKAAPFLFTPQGKSREHFDLPGYTAAQITRIGLPAPLKTGGCTYADADRYFSHRHASNNLSAAGRQAALIAIG